LEERFPGVRSIRLPQRQSHRLSIVVDGDKSEEALKVDPAIVRSGPRSSLPAGAFKFSAIYPDG
jgi:hypothetical protein